MSSLHDTVISSLASQSELAKKFVECFDQNFLQDASKLSVSLSQLEINCDHTSSFDENVSLHEIQQLQKLYYQLGLKTTFKDELAKIEQDKKIVSSMFRQIEELKSKKEKIEFDESKQKALQENIENFKQQRKELSEKLTKLNGFNDVLQKDFLSQAKSKNEELKIEIEELENELKGCDFIPTEEALEQRIIDLENQYKSFVGKNIESSY